MLKAHLIYAMFAEFREALCNALRNYFMAAKGQLQLS